MFRTAPFVLITALASVAAPAPARAADPGSGAVALLSWREGQAGRDQLRRLESRLAGLPMDSAVRGLVAEVDLAPPEARLTLLLAGALKLRDRQPDAVPDCPKAALRSRYSNEFETGLLNNPPVKCGSLGGAALWGDGQFPNLEADSRRTAVVAWLQTRRGSEWAGPEARAKADWFALLEGQFAAETLRALGALNGLAAADLEKLERTLHSAGDSLPGIVGGMRLVTLYTTLSAMSGVPEISVALLDAGVSEAMMLDGRHLPCAKALAVAVVGEPDVNALGLEVCDAAVEEARRSTGRGTALPGAAAAAAKKSASAKVRAAGPAWALLDSYADWAAFDDVWGDHTSLREETLRMVGEGLAAPE